jgi:hypothetical protein
MRLLITREAVDAHLSAAGELIDPDASRQQRARALRRAGAGDRVGGCRMLWRVDEDPARRAAAPVPQEGCCTVALRAVGGPLSGRVLSLGDRLELGAQSRIPLDLPQGEQASLRIFWHAGQLMLEAGQSSASHPLRVNGVVADRLALQPGDQIGLASHRFVIDAPGMMPEAPVPELQLPLAPEVVAGPRGEVWWLIVTAAVLALGIAMVLLIRF